MGTTFRNRQYFANQIVYFIVLQLPQGHNYGTWLRIATFTISSTYPESDYANFNATVAILLLYLPNAITTIRERELIRCFTKLCSTKTFS